MPPCRPKTNASLDHGSAQCQTTSRSDPVWPDCGRAPYCGRPAFDRYSPRRGGNMNGPRLHIVSLVMGLVLVGYGCGAVSSIPQRGDGGRPDAGTGGTATGGASGAA